MTYDKKAKVKKGWLVVAVGLGDEDSDRRFTMPISYLQHPLFGRLLEQAHEVYGYRSSGPLRLPCTVDDFLHLRWLIEREPQNGRLSGTGGISLLSC
ncbi:Auxin-induced protein X10A [Apostasia shenzhenica]|uniref:Auxin-induced protein X10A n=1 Tax=Apostasia shenzhenica TaxID=1088818 RepID=A0A2I0B7I4_9ASPA|nr:Auxin-induced protein X10A [Apostasia shenzhenica]